MSFVKVKAFPRSRSGKGPARRLRAKELVPAVLYGRAVETIKISVNPRELIKALAGPHRTNTVLELEIEGKSEPCPAIVRDHQFDPVSRALLHVDFYAVGLDQQIDMKVPFNVEGRSAGEQLGGELTKKFRTLPIQCKPADIPTAVVLDVTNIGLDESFTAGQLALPPGVNLKLDPKTAVVSVLSKKAEVETPAETVQPAAAAAAKPAAAAAKPKDKK
jgi:large subunit ribosomal protein L25